MEIISRAASRVDFGGGTLDLPFFAEREKGATLNCGIDKFGYAKISQNGKEFILNSLNYNKVLRFKKKEDIKYNGELDLIKAALKRTDFFEKVTLTAYHEMKPHSRLGTSSSISVAVLGALLAYKRRKINRIIISDTATMMEREELKMDNGPQDQYAAALGGINMLRYNGKRTSVEKVKVKDDVIYELEKNLILCYLDSTDVAGDVNHETVEGYERGDDKVVGAIKNIKQITFDMYKALKKGNLNAFAELLNEENKNRERLNKDIVSPVCRKYIDIGMKSGAVAAKILGAGAGGTLLFYSDDNKREKLIRSLENKGARVFDFRFDFSGLTIWKR